VNGPTGQTGARVQCLVVAERRQELATVYRHSATTTLAWDLRRKFMDVLDITAPVNASSIGTTFDDLE